MEDKEILAKNEAEKIIKEREEFLALEAKYKETHGAVGYCKSTHEEKEIICWFKKPSRMALGSALAIMDSDLIAACEMIFDSAVIVELSPEWELFRNDDGRFIGITRFLQSLAVVKKSTYKIL